MGCVEDSLILSESTSSSRPSPSPSLTTRSGSTSNSNVKNRQRRDSVRNNLSFFYFDSNLILTHSSTKMND